MKTRTTARARATRATLAAIGSISILALAACATPSQGSASANVGLPDAITLSVPYSPGGGTDTWARFIAPYLSATMDGEPTVLVENVPGGESITGSNQFVNRGGTDGTTVLVTSGTTYIQALLGRSGVEFDFSKMEPLMLNGTGGVAYVSASTGITGIDDLVNYDKTLSYGGISATGLDLTLLQAFDVLGVDIDATFGFEGRGPARLALERGETTLDYQTTSAYLSQVQPSVDAGTVVPLFSFGVLEDGKIVRDPALPDLPTLEEAYESVNGKEPSGDSYVAYKAFLVPGYVYQKGIWANEGTPEAVVDSYRSAARAISTDADFIDKSEDILGGYPLLPGDVAAAALAEAFSIPATVRQYTLDMLATKYDITL
jgi:tripartite-type tricarboxylate transporter receptor subunit TctC